MPSERRDDPDGLMDGESLGTENITRCARWRHRCDGRAAYRLRDPETLSVAMAEAPTANSEFQREVPHLPWCTLAIRVGHRIWMRNGAGV